MRDDQERGGGAKPGDTPADTQEMNDENTATRSGKQQPATTYNVVGFYEKGPLQMRLAYNYRNAYEQTAQGNRGQPVNVDAYGIRSTAFARGALGRRRGLLVLRRERDAEATGQVSTDRCDTLLAPACQERRCG